MYLGTSTFYTITAERHFVIWTLQLLPRVPVQMEARLQDTHSMNLASLPLPNPFKALKARSVEHLSLGENAREPGRVALDEERDLGELFASGSPSGFRARNTDGKMLAIVWSQYELMVS